LPSCYSSHTHTHFERMLRFATVAAAATAAAAVAIPDPEWIAYKAKYKKHYADDVDEQQRYALFQEAKTRVAGLNELNGGGNVFGINWMSDRHDVETYKRGLVKPKDFKATAPVLKFETSRAPTSINWRDTEAVTGIKNQGQCGSCWAFSATEAIESQMILGTGGKFAVNLSPQQVASCTPAPAMGCNGGFTEKAYDYVKSAPGLANAFFIEYEQSLTQSQETMLCSSIQAKVDAINGTMKQLQGAYAQVSGYSYAVPPCTAGSCENQDLKGFAAALERTPLSICVNAGAWNDYVGGVMTSAACGPMGAMYQDHCVMATGFNTTAPTPYWIVRNSWSDTFGENGYIYLEMAKNTCGLADDTTIPTVKLDLTQEEHAEAAVRREMMFQRATQGTALPNEIVV